MRLLDLKHFGQTRLELKESGILVRSAQIVSEIAGRTRLVSLLNQLFVHFPLNPGYL